MKNLLIIFVTAIVLLASCTKEPAINPNAMFTTKLVDNTSSAGETFYIYLDNCRGDFYTLYTGLTSGTTWKPDTITSGTSIDNTSDSVAVTYANAGEYKLTLVTSSSGNWGEEYLVDDYTENIIIVDGRTGFASMEVNKREGIISATENEVLFYAHKLEDITDERVKFLTISGDAEVYVGDELQSSGRNYHDFSALNPGDDEGRPVIYTVKALNGTTEDYTAMFILREPSSEKILYGLSSDDLEADFMIDQDNKDVTVSYYEGVSLIGKLLADGSSGAIVRIGSTEIQEKAKKVDLSSATAITVEAEDVSVQDYAIVLYEKEMISAFDFTAFDPGSGLESLNPVLEGVVDFELKTIELTVPVNMDLDKVVATFEGISDFTVKIDGTALTSGVTEFDYSSKAFNVEVYDGSILIDTYALTVH